MSFGAAASPAPGTRHEAPPAWTKIHNPLLPVDLPESGTWDARVPDGKLRAIRSVDEGLWHLSVSHDSRLPTWDEIADARYRFIPDRADMAMRLPPRAEWVNHHPRTLHLWEIAPTERLHA